MVSPTVLLVLDGWGIAPPGPGNAISLSKLTNLPSLWASYPHTELAAAGEAVGLPSGEDGNTETGHINIGAGRVVYQDLPRINMSIADGSFYTNDAFVGAIHHAQNNKSNIHLMGLVSDAGVHASREHLYALLVMLKLQGCTKNVFIHAFTDGRDSPPQSAIRFISELEAKCELIGVGKLATIIGRYYPMDRDRRWERTEIAYHALTKAVGEVSSSAKKSIEASYKAGVTDEFIKPVQLAGPTGKPYPRIADHDAIIFFNYRIDRPRQLTRAFLLPDFEKRGSIASFDPYSVKYHGKHVVEDDSRQRPFKRTLYLPNLFFVTMTEYERGLPCTVAYPTEIVHNTLGRVYADRKLRQLRASETEKERFVTYYFSGLHEDPFPGEDHLIVPSPKVATYDLKPEMSVVELTDRVIERLRLGVYSLIVVNFANPDMVGHTGNIPAAIVACQIADTYVGRIVEAVLSVNATCVVTADHGNVEEMLGPNGEVDTEHSMFTVPFMMISKRLKGFASKLPKGKLGDIAPTILAYSGIPIPSEMNGVNLLENFQLPG